MQADSQKFGHRHQRTFDTFEESTNAGLDRHGGNDFESLREIHSDLRTISAPKKLQAVAISYSATSR